MVHWGAGPRKALSRRFSKPGPHAVSRHRRHMGAMSGTVSTPSTSHSPHTGPQPVQGPGGSTLGTHCATRIAAGCTGQQDRAGKEGRPGAEAGAQRAGQVRGGRHVDSAPAIRGSARSRPRARMGCGRGRNKAGDIDGAERKGRVKPCSETGHSPEAWRATENEALEGGEHFGC